MKVYGKSKFQSLASAILSSFNQQSAKKTEIFFSIVNKTGKVSALTV